MIRNRTFKTPALLTQLAQTDGNTRRLVPQPRANQHHLIRVPRGHRKRTQTPANRRPPRRQHRLLDLISSSISRRPLTVNLNPLQRTRPNTVTHVSISSQLNQSSAHTNRLRGQLHMLSLNPTIHDPPNLLAPLDLIVSTRRFNNLVRR